jgi:Ni,Fe-hydrogenase III large subunit
MESSATNSCLTKGDVLARALMRKKRVEKSVKLIKDLLSGIGAITNLPKPNYSLKFEPSSVAFPWLRAGEVRFAIALLQMRMEICSITK